MGPPDPRSEPLPPAPTPPRRGILLAGGRGTRLAPMTLPVSKHLLPVYDKPLIYYSLSIPMLAGIRDILVLSTPEDLPAYQSLLSDGSAWGIDIRYAEQAEPRGIAEAPLLGEEFLDGAPSLLVLGDNLLHGARLAESLQEAAGDPLRAGGFAYRVGDPSRFGVARFDESDRVVSLREKPPSPASPWALIGLYLLPPDAPERARSLTPSPRGELEIVDLLNSYLAEDRLDVTQLGRGTAWLDTGTPRSLLQAAQFVEVLQERQGLRVACPEEIAYRMGYIDSAQLHRLARAHPSPDYGAYLQDVAGERRHDP